MNKREEMGYLKAVFACIPTPCNVQVEAFDRDVGRVSKGELFEVE
jgi:hypothetical protein